MVMKHGLIPFIFGIFLALGCPQGSLLASELSGATPLQNRPVTTIAAAEPIPSSPPETTAKSGTENLDDYQDLDDLDQGPAEEKADIADPLEPFNRAMYHFNDKMYFWVLKPVAQGYGKVVPEVARVSVNNFYTNLLSPVRFVNCLLQANLKDAATELGRFLINTIWGVGGLLDPAAGKEIDLAKKDKDFGQTLGIYGVGQGFYINWPILGPSSPRDTIGTVGDLFFSPTFYFGDWTIWAGTKLHDKVNDTSLKIGDYESLKGAAIDPYVAIRDAYVQYRLKMIKQKGTASGPSQDVKSKEK
jgi:phospholipid-binding lipoprotein MlaA